MQRQTALFATVALLYLLFPAQTVTFPLPDNNLTLASQIFPPTIIYRNTPFPLATRPTISVSEATTIICRPDPRYHGAMQAGMYVLAVILTLLTGLLAGLTMGVMSVDAMRLQIWVHTGDREHRENARSILDIRKHPNWLLASLILSSVAIAEALPLVLSHLFRPGYWVPFLLSTLIVAVVGQLLPYAIMPMYILRIAGKMGWFFKIIKWGTCWVSVPTGWLIERGKEWRFKHGHRRLDGILEMDELEVFLKLHEVEEGFGGKVKEEVGGVVRGIIRNQDETVGQHVDQPWDSVKTLRLGDRISDELVKEVTGWSLEIILVTEWPVQHEGLVAVPAIIGTISTMDLYDASYMPIPHQCVRDLAVQPVLIIREGSSTFSTLVAFAQTNARFAVVLPTKNGSVSASGSIKWTSGMNLSRPTSLSDSEDPDAIPTVSDTAVIQTPLGIVTIDVLLRSLFSRTERYHKAWSDPNSGGEIPEEGQGNLPTRLGIEILSSTRAEMEGKGHNLRTLRNRGFAALGTAALRRSLRKKRQNEENQAFNAAPLLENARPGQDDGREESPRLIVPKHGGHNNKSFGLRRRTPNQGLNINTSPVPLTSPPKTPERRGGVRGPYTPPDTPRSASAGVLHMATWRSISNALSYASQSSATEAYRGKVGWREKVTAQEAFDGGSGRMRAETFTDFSEDEETRVVLRGGHGE